MPRTKQAKLSPWYRPAPFRYTGALSLANMEANSSHAKMFSLVPTGSRILETGCANGRFTRVLVEHGCRVVGVELDPGAASDAAEFCEQVIVGNLEDPSVQAQIPGDFDLLLFGDVLEHLVEPWSVLRTFRSKLKPGGCIVVSIPNIAHWDGRIGLLTGKFDYQDEGVLDSTHLRFFTHRTVWELLDQTGYRIVSADRVTRLPAWVYKIRLVRRYAPKLLLPLLARLAPNLFTLQFIVKAVPR